MRWFSVCYGLALRMLVAMFPYLWDESCVKARRLCMRSYWKNAA
jgi:hypothetical protein